jgi:hypothetical protein
MSDLRGFKGGLDAYLTHPHARPFVCTGSPLKCRSFIVGLNAATQLKGTFSDYWSESTGFDRDRFNNDYCMERSLRGNRLRIEAIAKEIEPCLQTNLYATPSRKARQLTDRREPIISYLFKTIRPELVFVHSSETGTMAGTRLLAIRSAGAALHI